MHRFFFWEKTENNVSNPLLHSNRNDFWALLWGISLIWSFSLVAVLLHYSLTMFIEWLSLHQKRDDCISKKKLCSSIQILICKVLCYKRKVMIPKSATWNGTHHRGYRRPTSHLHYNSFCLKWKIPVFSLLGKKKRDLSNILQLWSLKAMPQWMQRQINPKVIFNDSYMRMLI